MIAAGMLIWANLSPLKTGAYSEDGCYVFNGHIVKEHAHGKVYGWPSMAVKTYDLADPVNSYYNSIWSRLNKELVSREYFWGGIALDALITLATLSAVWFGCERLIRYRSGQNATVRHD